MEAVLHHVRAAVRFVRRYRDYGHRLALKAALSFLREAFCECNRLGRHDLRSRVCRMRNWVSAELARAT